MKGNGAAPCIRQGESYPRIRPELHPESVDYPGGYIAAREYERMIRELRWLVGHKDEEIEDLEDEVGDLTDEVERTIKMQEIAEGFISLSSMQAYFIKLAQEAD